MRVLISGASGLIGSALTDRLAAEGMDVARMVRRPSRGADEVTWSVSEGVSPGDLSGVDAVVHLAGESIAGGRWTDERKRRIRESRVLGTRALSESIARAASPPPVLISASAVGYYGDRGDETLLEDSEPGHGFLPDVCREWEAATEPAAAVGVRVVTPRLGMVLSVDGGALAKMAPIFRLGLGGRLGAGRQYVSWISLDDGIESLNLLLRRPDLSGPVNIVAPEPVRNHAFTAELARVLRRPAFLPAPEFALKLALGELANEALLASARVLPGRLTEAGYHFRHPKLTGALRDALSRD